MGWILFKFVTNIFIRENIGATQSALKILNEFLQKLPHLLG